MSFLVIGFNHKTNAFEISASDRSVGMTIDRAQWAPFLEWLRSGWEVAPFGTLDIVESPRTKIRMFVVAHPPKNETFSVVFSAMPDRWTELVDSLIDLSNTLHQDFIIPIDNDVSKGVSLEKAILDHCNRSILDLPELNLGRPQPPASSL